MKCTHVRTDEVQEWDGKEWKDITNKEPFAVGAWKNTEMNLYTLRPTMSEGR